MMANVSLVGEAIVVISKETGGWLAVSKPSISNYYVLQDESDPIQQVVTSKKL